MSGSHSSVGQALMWVWSHMTLGCWVEVAYWCRHHIVTHISYQGWLCDWKLLCVCVCLACSVSLWMAVCVCVWERNSNRERSHLVSWKFRGNEHNVLECKCLWKSKLHARKVRLGCLKGWYEKTWEDRQQLSAEIVQRKGRWADTLSATLNDPGLILTCTIILLWAFIFLMQICSYCL